MKHGASSDGDGSMDHAALGGSPHASPPKAHRRHGPRTSPEASGLRAAPGDGRHDDLSIASSGMAMLPRARTAASRGGSRPTSSGFGGARAGLPARTDSGAGTAALYKFVVMRGNYSHLIREGLQRRGWWQVRACWPGGAAGVCVVLIAWVGKLFHTGDPERRCCQPPPPPHRPWRCGGWRRYEQRRRRQVASAAAGCVPGSLHCREGLQLLLAARQFRQLPACKLEHGGCQAAGESLRVHQAAVHQARPAAVAGGLLQSTVCAALALHTPHVRRDTTCERGHDHVAACHRVVAGTCDPISPAS